VELALSRDSEILCSDTMLRQGMAFVALAVRAVAIAYPLVVSRRRFFPMFTVGRGVCASTSGVDLGIRFHPFQYRDAIVKGLYFIIHLPIARGVEVSRSVRCDSGSLDAGESVRCVR